MLPQECGRRAGTAPTPLSKRKAEIEERLVDSVLVDVRPKRIDPKTDTFDASDPQIKRDIIRMIVQYLEDEEYTTSMMTVQDEANVKISANTKRRKRIRRLQASILAGDWAEVEDISAKINLRKHKTLYYSLYKQHYLELIDRQEYQKAFSFLGKYLKPLEYRSFEHESSEFADLCYLLTCKSVQEAPSFRDWLGVTRSREKLVEQFETILLNDVESFAELSDVPAGRLLELLQQAVAYQMEFNRFHPKLRSHVASLLHDHQSFVLPNVLHQTFYGHVKNVKCVEFIGDEALSISSGSSDNSVRIWSTESGVCTHELRGHSSRVWDTTSECSGRFVASASADTTIKIWDLEAESDRSSVATLEGHEGDVYAVQYHPGSSHLISGGYDQVARLYDIENRSCLVSLRGHQSSISSTIFNRLGNLVITGSKDCSVKFWDITSGICIKTYASQLGEVTSLQMNSSGTQLLTCSKDNSNRLWDVRVGRPFQRFKGHQNTSKNFVRADFGPNQSLVVSGSEDGRIYIWDIESGELVQRLGGHEGTVFSVKWSASQSVLASCSQDTTIKTWIFDANEPHFVSDIS